MWHMSCLDISLAGLNFARRKKNADAMINFQGAETADESTKKAGRMTDNLEEIEMKVPSLILGLILTGTTLTVAATTTVDAADNANRYSDRDRMRTSKDAEDKLEKALKTGETKDFYRKELEKMGWKVTSVNYDKPDYVEYEIVKGDQSYEVQVDIDKNSHKGTKVDVTMNAWKTDATKQALKQNETQARR